MVGFMLEGWSIGKMFDHLKGKLIYREIPDTSFHGARAATDTNGLQEITAILRNNAEQLQEITERMQILRFEASRTRMQPSSELIRERTFEMQREIKILRDRINFEQNMRSDLEKKIKELESTRQKDES